MSDAMLLLDIGASAGELPNTTPAPVRYGTWFPVPHQASPIPPVDGATPTPVADGVLLEWAPSDQPDVEYRIERAPNATGPWTDIARVREPRYLVSDPSGATWHYRITPVIRGKAGAPVTVEGAAKQAPSVADLVAQQAALDAEVLARTQGDVQTALAAAADAQAKADAALANASEQTDAALAQALAAANAALTTATAQTEALAAEVAEIVNAPEWEAAHSYITGWLVRHNNALYRATTDTTGQPPDQHPAVWEHLGQYSSVAGIAAAALEQATTTATDLTAEAARINALVARMPGGNGQLATQASVSAEQAARANGDAANASAIQAVNATVEGKADASALSAVTTRVEGLEAAGYGSNLLPNTTFNSGIQPWFNTQTGSTWTAPAVDLGGDTRQPPGMHSLGIKCTSGALDNTQRGRIYAPIIPVIPGQRYMASCHISNHRCQSRLYLVWRDADNVAISSVASPILARKTGGQNPGDWHHALATGMAPVNAAYAQIHAAFIGDGGTNSHGWMLRPMLEQARDTQTEPSPWNPGGLETSSGLLIESQRTDAIMARLPAGTGNVAAEATLVAEQAARISGDAANAGAISVEASRLDGVMARLPGGNGQLATQASVVAEQNARIAGDSANATAIQAVTASVAGKADAAALSSVTTRVEGLEATGSGSNLLINATFNSGVRGWKRSHSESTWTAPAVDLGGSTFQPPGLHSLGIKCTTSGELVDTQRGRIYSDPPVAVLPGQRYLASCHIANHRCKTRLALIWRDADNTVISSVFSPKVGRKSGGIDLANWHHAIAIGTAPANAACAQLRIDFYGDGGSNAYGWIVRPMLEQASATQTAPSPWNPGGLETSAQLLIESERTDALIARMPAGTGKLAPEAALVSEQAARISGDAANAGAITAEASRINGLLSRMPAGGGKAASEASVVDEQNARIAGDSANATAIQAVNASMAGKADAAVVQSMGVRVGSLEAAGNGVNLLPNTTFNSGVATYFLGGWNAGWNDLNVDHGGADWHPPGIHSMGTYSVQGLPPTQWVQIMSAPVPVTPGQRLMASSYTACHQCQAQLYLMWYNADGSWLTEVAGDKIGPIHGGTSLSNWARLHKAWVTPDNAVFARVVIRLWGMNLPASGWMLRPMLEQAGEYQTEPSPWNPGGMETSAEYGLVVKADNVIGGMRIHNDGQIVDTAFAADIFRVLSPSGTAEGLEFQNGTLRVWKGNAQRIIGNGFGPNGDLMEYFGPNVGTANASKANATMWMDIHGNAWWGGDITWGPLKYTTHTASTQTVGLELVNGPFPTNGNLRTVTVTFSRHSSYTRTQHGGIPLSLGNGNTTATIQIYRKIGHANEALWQTLNASGSAWVLDEGEGGVGGHAAVSWSGEKTVTDTSSSTQTVRYRAVITALTGRTVNGTINQVKHSQSLKITSVEGA